MDTVTATATPSAVTPSAAPAPQGAEPKAHKLWLAAYVIVLLGKFADWVPGLGGVPVAKVGILFALLFSWRARATLPAVRVRSLPIARVALAFLALAFASILFSAYISMSVAAVYLIVVLLISFVLLLKITETVSDVERLLLALCVAAAGLAVAAVFSYGGGRASVSENIDPNDVAYGLVTVLPISRALALTKKKGRLILNGLSGVLLLAILLTGSRGGVLGLGTVILLLAAFPLKFAKTGGLKLFRLGRFVAVVGLIAVLGTGLWSYLPGETRERMATLLDLGSDYNAGTSKSSRSAIWIRNSKAVWSRPIGYGLGTSEYVDGLTGGAYRALHNSFVEAFVELGFLGLLLFCTSYLVTLRQLGRVSNLSRDRTADPEAAKASLYARALRIALAGNLVSGFFLSDAYSEVLWTVIAISAALVRIGLPAQAKPRG